MGGWEVTLDLVNPSKIKKPTKIFSVNIFHEIIDVLLVQYHCSGFT